MEAKSRSINSTQPCRLCLRFVESSEARKQFLDVFDVSLADKIYDCLGLHISPDDRIRRICYNCEQTVRLIDEFRVLCRQTAELYELVQVRPMDDDSCARYHNHISVLRELVQEQQDAINKTVAGAEWRELEIADVDGSSYTVSIKEECAEYDEENQAEPDDGGELSDMIEIKTEQLDLGDSDDNQEETAPSVAPTSILTQLSMTERLAIAQEMNRHPVLWDTSLSSSTDSKNNAWKEVAHKFSMDVRIIRMQWCRLRHLYRRRHMRSTTRKYKNPTTYDRLIALLHIMFNDGTNLNVPVATVTKSEVSTESDVDDHKEEGDKSPFETSEQKLAFVKVLCDFPCLWCRDHPDFKNYAQRKKAWVKIGAMYNVDSEVVKSVWQKIRTLYRDRYSRLVMGRFRFDNPLITDPLYQQLDMMLNTDTKVPRPAITREIVEVEEDDKDGETGSDKRFGSDVQLKFAKLCQQYKILWDSQHAGFGDARKRNTVWDNIAVQINVTRSIVQKEWKRLRDMYRGRCQRLARGLMQPDNDLVTGELFQILDKIFAKNRQEWKATLVGSQITDGEENTTKVKALKELFGLPDGRIKLAEEILKHGIIWNVQHRDYKKVDMRRATWDQIAAVFNTNAYIVRAEWKKFQDMHRLRKFRTLRGDTEISLKNPLHALLDKLFAHDPVIHLQPLNGDIEQDKNDGESSEGSSQKDQTLSTSQRRKTYDDDGCIQVERSGIIRHEKICELCGKQVERSFFEYHMNKHYGLTPYACSNETCGKRYSSKNTRDRHEELVHSFERYKFECDECGEKFKLKTAHSYHYAIKHKSQEIPCDICGKILPHKITLRLHMRNHKTNPVCQVCGKKLAKTEPLEKHMLTHAQVKKEPCDAWGPFSAEDSPKHTLA